MVSQRVLPKEVQLYGTYAVGGHTFTVRYGYIEESDRISERVPRENILPVFPDFLKGPLYDTRSFPLVTDIQCPCEHYAPDNLEAPEDWCRDCRYFPQGKTADRRMCVRKAKKTGDNKMKIRLLSLLLCVCMVITLLPVTALAAPAKTLEDKGALDTIAADKDYRNSIVANNYDVYDDIPTLLSTAECSVAMATANTQQAVRTWLMESGLPSVLREARLPSNWTLADLSIAEVPNSFIAAIAGIPSDSDGTNGANRFTGVLLGREAITAQLVCTIATTAGAHIHNWSNTWEYDLSSHFHRCVAPGCPITDITQMMDFGQHVSATPDQPWVTSGTEHKQLCGICLNYFSVGSHTFLGPISDTCTVCGYKRAILSLDLVGLGVQKVFLAPDSSEALPANAVLNIVEYTPAASQLTAVIQAFEPAAEPETTASYTANGERITTAKPYVYHNSAYSIGDTIRLTEGGPEYLVTRIINVSELSGIVVNMELVELNTSDPTRYYLSSNGLTSMEKKLEIKKVTPAQPLTLNDVLYYVEYTQDEVYTNYQALGKNLYLYTPGGAPAGRLEITPEKKVGSARFNEGCDPEAIKASGMPSGPAMNYSVGTTKYTAQLLDSLDISVSAGGVSVPVPATVTMTGGSKLPMGTALWGAHIDADGTMDMAGGESTEDGFALSIHANTQSPFLVLALSESPVVAPSKYIHTVPTEPIIIVQPTNQSVTAGQTATFSVTAAGIPAPSYHWQVSTDGGANWSSVSDGTGGVSASYTTPATVLSQSGYQYRCNILNNQGNVTSDAATLIIGTPGGGDAGADVPKTGDSATPLLWIGLMLLAGLGLATSAAHGRNKQHGN